MSGSVVDAVAAPGARDDVEVDTLHSNMAVWPRKTLVLTGSDSNIGDAEIKIRIILYIILSNNSAANANVNHTYHHT